MTRLGQRGAVAFAAVVVIALVIAVDFRNPRDRNGLACSR
jgi:hypothetical protein